MKKNKKGFTLVELLAVITILGIIATIATASLSQTGKRAKMETFRDLEKNMITSAKNYLVENPRMIPDQGGNVAISLKTLIKEEYSYPLGDPDKSGSVCNTEGSNASYVFVRRTDTTGVNIKLEYDVCLKCSKYSSESCKSSLPANLK